MSHPIWCNCSWIFRRERGKIPFDFDLSCTRTGCFGVTQPARICPRCAADDRINRGEDVWPPGWCCRACGYKVPVSDGIAMFAPELAHSHSGFHPGEFATLAIVEREHFWFVPRNRLLTSLIIRYFPHATRFLEVGCGTGMVLSAICDLHSWECLVGSELHPSGLVEARRRLGSRARFVQMDARMIPARAAFDVAGAFDVLEHIPDDVGVLAAMHTALATDGGVILSVPQHPTLWSKVDERAHHVRRYRRGELEQKVASTGFDVVFSSSYTVSLFPLMAISRLLSGRPRPSQQTMHSSVAQPTPFEFRLPRSVNALVRFILEAEVSLTLAGVRFPVGGSRVVVAIKR
jgi:SAM-dependent methyltransferase